MSQLKTEQLEFEQMSIFNIVACKALDTKIGEFEYMDYHSDLKGGLSVKLHKQIIKLEDNQTVVKLTQEQLNNTNEYYGLDGNTLVANMLKSDMHRAITQRILNKIIKLGHANFVSIDKLSFWLKIKKWFTLLQGKQWKRKIKIDSIDQLVKVIAYYQNRILHDTRIGNANAIITNGKIASLLQDHPTFKGADINQPLTIAGIIYNVGEVFNMSVFVDPNMRWNDDTVILARSNTDFKTITSGVMFFYDENNENTIIQTIAEENFAPIITASIPYSIVSLGKSPEKNYMTLHFELNKNVTL